MLNRSLGYTENLSLNLDAKLMTQSVTTVTKERKSLYGCVSSL